MRMLIVACLFALAGPAWSHEQEWSREVGALPRPVLKVDPNLPLLDGLESLLLHKTCAQKNLWTWEQAVSVFNGTEASAPELGLMEGDWRRVGLVTEELPACGALDMHGTKADDAAGARMTFLKKNPFKPYAVSVQGENDSAAANIAAPNRDASRPRQYLYFNTRSHIASAAKGPQFVLKNRSCVEVGAGHLLCRLETQSESLEADGRYRMSKIQRAYEAFTRVKASKAKP